MPIKTEFSNASSKDIQGEYFKYTPKFGGYDGGEGGGLGGADDGVGREIALTAHAFMSATSSDV